MCSAAVITSLAALLTLRQQIQLIRSFTTLDFNLITRTHPKTMPPRRPLPDLVLITAFKMLTPNDQLLASLTSPRCAVLVRAANRTVKTLIIADPYSAFCQTFLKDRINCNSLASMPAMQPLMDIPGEPSFPHYPMTTHLSKWHCLKIDSKEQIDSATIDQITTIFSAVTDLKFISYSYIRRDPLVTLLLHPTWQCQLTNLMVMGTCEEGSHVVQELITAINGLTALQQLALYWFYHIDLPDLTILAQLKVVVFHSAQLKTFLRSFERYAADNADLQVHLFSYDTKALLSLSQPLHSRIVRFGFESQFKSIFDLSTIRRVCSQFRFLTSLSTDAIPFAEVGQLFTALSQLHQLVHLKLLVGFEDVEVLPAPRSPRPLAQMNSLRALELHISIFSHSQVQWLNLPVTMPNLQSIYISMFYCCSCKVLIDCFDETEPQPLLNSSEALNCFHSSLFTLHSGVSMRRFILNSYEESTSAEKLLLQSQ